MEISEKIESAEMNNAPTNEELKEARNEPVTINDASRAASSKRGLKIFAAVAILLVVAVVGLFGYLRWQQQNQSGAGRPVPAPRNTSFSDSGNSDTMGTMPKEATVTLSPEQLASTGIKTETVGEKLHGAMGTTLATGVVQNNAYRETPVVSLVGGIVLKVNAKLGQSVKQGQTVAVIFSDELAQTQSRYLAARAEFEEHHKHYGRTVKLVEIGAASREELEQATSKLRTAESELASLRQRLLLLGMSPQRVDALQSTAQISSSEITVSVPASGTITSRSVNQGEVIEANKELLRVTDLSSVWVIGRVYEKDLGRIRVGSGASITTDAYPGRVFRGQVAYIDPRLDQETRTAQVRIELPNPGQMLKIGMYVNVAFATMGGSEMTAPTVPTAAVQNINNRHVIFVATDKPNVFILRPVQIGLESNGLYPVLEGVTVGERVVTKGSFLLRAEWLKLHPNGN